MSKLFCEAKITSCLMAHDNPRWLNRCLENLASYSKNCYINMNDPTIEVKNVVENYIKNSPEFIEKVIETINKDGKWNKGLQLDNTIRLLDDVKPDIVIFCNETETLPPDLWDRLRDFWANESKKTIWFNIMYLWNDDKHYRNDKEFKNSYQVRVLKWTKNLTYLPYKGGCCPINKEFIDKKTGYYAGLPVLNYSYLDKNDRYVKFLKKNRDSFIEEKRAIIEEVPKVYFDSW